MKTLWFIVVGVLAAPAPKCMGGKILASGADAGAAEDAGAGGSGSATDGSAGGGSGSATDGSAGGSSDPPLVIFPGGVKSIAMDATSFYAAMPGGDVLRAPKSGGAPVQIPNVMSRADLAAVDDTGIYFADFSSALWHVGKDGTSPAQLAQDTAIRDIALDATDVYWVTGGAEGAVRKVRKGGGTPITLSLGEQSPAHIVLDDAYAYWTMGPSESGARGIRRVSKSGASAVETLAVDSGVQLYVHGGYVYWAQGWGAGGEGVVRVPKAGGFPSVLARGDFANSLAVDQTGVYYGFFGAERAGQVFWVPLEGGTPTEVAKPSPVPGMVSGATSQILLDECWVYAVSYLPTYEHGTTSPVRRVPKVNAPAGCR